MKFSRQLFVVLIFLFCALFCVWAFAAEPPAPVPVSPSSVFPPSVSPTAVLPSEFAGWQVKGSITRSADPATADAVNAPVLKEYGFQRLGKASSSREEGR